MLIILCGRPGGCRAVQVPEDTPEQAEAFKRLWLQGRAQGIIPAESPTVQAVAQGQIPMFDLVPYTQRREH